MIQKIYLPKLSLIVAFFLLCVLLTSCFSDTCTQGATMTNPRVVDTFDASKETPKLVVTWDLGTERGSDLPDSYFEAVSLDCISIQNCPFSLLTNALYDATSNSITVTFLELSEYLSTNDTLEFGLVFPDREQYINCTHPGNNDTYLIQVTLNFNEAEFVDAVFSEIKQLGAF